MKNYTTNCVVRSPTSTSYKFSRHSSSSTGILISILFYFEFVSLRVIRAVLKTNFYQPTKVALSFRLTPDFLPEVEYPNKPFGLFFVIGSEFRGFHVRFRDVARGGIRIVRSRNREYVFIWMTVLLCLLKLRF